MSRNMINAKAELQNVADFLLEDIELMSDAEISEFLSSAGISPTDAPALVSNVASRALRQLGAKRLADARRALDGSTAKSAAVINFDAAQARSILQTYWRKHPDRKPAPSTLAARKGSEISDDTALKMLASLVELGAVSPEGEIS